MNNSMINGTNHLPCPGLWDVSFSCEMSNLATMVFELMIAGGVGLCLAYWFYTRENMDNKLLREIAKTQKSMIDYRRKKFIKIMLLRALDCLEGLQKIETWYLKNSSNPEEEFERELKEFIINYKHDCDRLEEYFLIHEDIVFPEIDDVFQKIITQNKNLIKWFGERRYDDGNLVELTEVKELFSNLMILGQEFKI